MNDSSMEWPAHLADEVALTLEHYPVPRAATLPLLWLAQREWGWISPEAMRLVAESTDQPPSHVRAVASFYSMLRSTPPEPALRPGQVHHTLQVCRTLSCDMAGCTHILDHIKQRLGVEEGGTTADGVFTLEAVECLAACGSGPVMQVDDGFLYEHLNPMKVDALLDLLRTGTTLPEPDDIGRWQWNHAS